MPYDSIFQVEKLNHNKEAHLCAFAHDVPTRAHLQFCLNCQPNEEIIKNRCLSLKNHYTPKLLIELQKTMPH